MKFEWVLNFTGCETSLRVQINFGRTSQVVQQSDTWLIKARQVKYTASYVPVCIRRRLTIRVLTKTTAM